MPLDEPAPDSGKADGAEVEEEQPKKKKGLPPIVIYAGIAVIMAVAGYFGGTRFLASSEKADEIETADTKDSEHDEGESEEAHKATEMIEFEDIIVNPAGTGGTRFLAVSIGFEVSGAETGKLFESRKPVIRDALISILGSKTIEQLSDAREKEITRYQIKKRVEHLLKTNDLEAVYFTNFVLQ